MATDEVLELNTIDIDENRNYGDTRYRTHPRVGEIVTIDIDGEGTALEVIMVGHSTEAIGSDLYVRNRGPIHKFISSIK